MVGNALNRVFEIALGSVVALVVALVVAPSRAHLLLYGATRDALAAMRELVELLLADLAAGSDRAVVVALHDRIRAAIERGSAIAEETARERATYIADTPDPEPLVRCLRRMSHDLASLARALPMAPPDPVLSRLARPARGLAVAFAAALSDIGEALTTAARPVPSLAPVTAALEGYEAAMQGLRRDGVSRALGDAEVEQVFAMAFALDQFVRNLEELTSRAREALSPDRPR